MKALQSTIKGHTEINSPCLLSATTGESNSFGGESNSFGGEVTVEAIQRDESLRRGKRQILIQVYLMTPGLKGLSGPKEIP